MPICKRRPVKNQMNFIRRVVSRLKSSCDPKLGPRDEGRELRDAHYIMPRRLDCRLWGGHFGGRVMLRPCPIGAVGSRERKEMRQRPIEGSCLCTPSACRSAAWQRKVGNFGSGRIARSKKSCMTIGWTSRHAITIR